MTSPPCCWERYRIHRWHLIGCGAGTHGTAVFSLGLRHWALGTGHWEAGWTTVHVHLVGQLGGEEFYCVLVNTRRSASIGFELRRRTLPHQTAEKELGFTLSFSAGLGGLKDSDTALSGLLARADTSLYEAKNSSSGHLVQ